MPPSPAFTSRFKASAANMARVSALAAVFACAAPAFAQQPPGEGEPEGSSWGLGLAVMSVQNAYKGTDRETRVLPMISYENRYVTLGGPNLELKLPGIELSDSQRLNFGVMTQLFDGAGYEAKDSPALAGMSERKSSIWVGAKMEWENDLADVKLEWLGDASGKSKGQRLALGLERKIMLSPRLMLIPQVGVEWVDKKYVDYYYGVRDSEATAGRAAYTGKATLNPEISLSGIYRFDRHHSMMLNVGVRSFGKEIKNSPIVGRSTENRVMLGYKYSF
ncbi:MAG: MipA/OmpV family protein [Ottowia sp.]|nr:MipA/OmpV family protein [Ottowia sp.]